MFEFRQPNESIVTTICITFHSSTSVWLFNTVECFVSFHTAFVCSSATDKVALLIGNLNYSHHPSLMAPTMDVYELAQHLRQLEFRVVSLLDLSKEEMNAAIEKFLQLLDKGVYGKSQRKDLWEIDCYLRAEVFVGGSCCIVITWG